MLTVPAIFFVVFGFQFTFTQWLQGVQDLSPLQAGLCFLPNAALVLIGSLLSGTALDYFTDEAGRRNWTGFWTSSALMSFAIMLLVLVFFRSGRRIEASKRQGSAHPAEVPA